MKVCSEGLLGCTYKPDGTILSGCLNGDKPYLYSMCSHEISGSRKPDIVLDECVCPLARLYSLESSYHFMYEVLDKIIIAEELGFQGKYMLFRNDYADCLLEQLRVSRDRVIWLDKRDSGKIFALKKAFDAEGFGLDSHKGLAVLNKFADDMLHRAGRKADYPGKIFIASGRKNKAPEGFAEIYHAEHSPEEMINFFMNADVVMSADCIAMACVLFMRRGAELISMFPNNWSSLLAGVIASRGLKYRPE
ncbi:MAG: DUF563 domain-containing protein [Synergistaceae bacterium]|nr:DUF563 domain-containing protein [Synergistaceae bacterium]